MGRSGLSADGEETTDLKVDSQSDVNVGDQVDDEADAV